MQRSVWLAVVAATAEAPLPSTKPACAVAIMPVAVVVPPMTPTSAVAHAVAVVAWNIAILSVPAGYKKMPQIYFFFAATPVIMVLVAVTTLIDVKAFVAV